MAANEHAAQKSALLSAGLFKRILVFLVVLLAALISSIIVEWLGLYFDWWDSGVNHSAEMVTQEVSYLSSVADKNIFITDISGVTFGGIESVDAARDRFGIINYFSQRYEAFAVGVFSAVNITKVFILRLTVMALSVQTFIVFGIVGTVRGLVARDLRKWGGGRESSGKYHLFLKLMPEIFMLFWFVYLSIPFSLNPFLVVGPAAILFGVLVSNYFYRLKKYL